MTILTLKDSPIRSIRGQGPARQHVQLIFKNSHEATRADVY